MEYTAQETALNANEITPKGSPLKIWWYYYYLGFKNKNLPWPVHEPKGHWFNSWSGYMPGLQARSPVGGMREASNGYIS